MGWCFRSPQYTGEDDGGFSMFVGPDKGGVEPETLDLEYDTNHPGWGETPLDAIVNMVTEAPVTWQMAGFALANRVREGTRE